MKVKSAAEARLATNMIVMVGLTNLPTFLPNSRESSFKIDQNGSEHSAPGRDKAQDDPSSPTANGLSGLVRSSQEINPGTMTRMIRSRKAYFVTLMVQGRAMK